MALAGAGLTYLSPWGGVPVIVLGIILAWWWGWGKDWWESRKRNGPVRIPKGYQKAEGITWNEVPIPPYFERPAFEISPDGESGVFYNSFTLRSDRRRQPIDLMILCSDKVLSADGAVDHIVGIPHPPLTPEIVGDKLVAVSLPEPSFGPVDAHRLNGRPAAPFDQTITVILGFEMLPDDAEERGKILNVYEK